MKYSNLIFILLILGLFLIDWLSGDKSIKIPYQLPTIALFSDTAPSGGHCSIEVKD